MKKNILYAFAFLLGVLVSCKEDNPLLPYGDDDGKAPQDVSNVTIRNTPGGAVIKYERPNDTDLSYVKAVYTNTHGELKEVRASRYLDSLEVVGLGNTDEYIVTLYAVDKFENTSSGVETKFNPLTPPVLSVKESLETAIDFGGFIMNFKNETGSDIAIYTLVKDEETNEYDVYDSYYTSLKDGKYAVRGLPNKETEFGLFVRDRFENRSDTLFFSGIPWREDELSKKLFVPLTVAGDVGWSSYGGSPKYAWDDLIREGGNFAHTAYPEPFPHRFTMDLGVDVKLSRFRIWQRPGASVLYQHGSPKHFKVYGRAERPEGGSVDDPMAGWTFLMECHSFKPSGLPWGQYSPEDEEYAALGEEFSFARDLSAVRYLRFELLESWSGMECSVIAELAFWGEIQE